MRTVELKKDIFWVGSIDWNIRTFHGHTYATRRGTTYNAYLILDDKVALVDTVHAPFLPELLEKIRQIVPLEKIDYIIANHVETDHSGALPGLLQYATRAKVVGSAKCKEGLEKHYGGIAGFQVVKTGDTLNLGTRTLEFIEAPMIHWPDSMFTYCRQERLLLPNDAFGQHYATSERFDDEVPQAILMEEAAKYYANILWPLGSVILKKLQELKNANLPIEMIAPSHGIIWRKEPGRIISAYQSWAQNETKQKAVIVYETMWGSTEKMARTIADALTDAGVSTALFDIARSDRTDVVTAMLDSKGFLFGSSTHDNGMLSIIASFLHFVKGLKPKNRLVCAFGSYGWAGGAVKEIETLLTETGLPIAQPAFTAQYVPDAGELQRCYEFGTNFARLINQG